MTVLADFHTVIGDISQKVESEVTQLGKAFDTGGRLTGEETEKGGTAAFLMYSVSGVFHSHKVYVNGQDVGSIERSSAGLGDGDHAAWSTQVIAMAGFRLNSGQNIITVQNLTGDEFWIKNLICFYHQDSD